jgi:hypothetical protein
MLTAQKSRLKDWIVPVLCVAVAFVVFRFMAENSETFQNCAEDYQYRAAQSSFPKQTAHVEFPLSARVNCWGRYIREVAEGIVGVFTIVLAGSTIALWLSTKKLWEITDDTLKHAQETSKKELRAYVGVEPAGISRYIKRPEDGPEEILGHFIIHNVGNVPAKRVSIFSTIEWSEDGERRTFNNCSVQDSPTVLQHGVRCSSEQGEGSLLKR